MDKDWEHGKLLLYLFDEPILEISPRLSSLGTKVEGSCERASYWRDHIQILGSLDQETTTYRKRRDEHHVESVIDMKTSAIAAPSTMGTMLRSLTLTCDPTHQNVRCYPIHCQIKGLGAQSFYFIKLRARLWNSTLIENYFDTYDRIDIQSFAAIQVNDALIFQTSTDNDNATVNNIVF